MFSFLFSLANQTKKDHLLWTMLSLGKENVIIYLKLSHPISEPNTVLMVIYKPKREKKLLYCFPLPLYYLIKTNSINISNYKFKVHPIFVLDPFSDHPRKTKKEYQVIGTFLLTIFHVEYSYICL